MRNYQLNNYYINSIAAILTNRFLFFKFHSFLFLFFSVYHYYCYYYYNLENTFDWTIKRGLTWCINKKAWKVNIIILFIIHWFSIIWPIDDNPIVHSTIQLSKLIHQSINQLTNYSTKILILLTNQLMTKISFCPMNY